jgi:uncharacterized membrane protein YdfJ with MMPL/SSD domain
VSFFGSLATLVVRFRFAVIAAWVLVLVLVLVAALTALGSEVNSDPSLFLSGSARSVQAQGLGVPLGGARTTSKVTIVAATSAGQLTSADVAAISREARLARQVADVQSVKYVAVSPGGNAVQLTATVGRDASDVAGLKPVAA